MAVTGGGNVSSASSHPTALPDGGKQKAPSPLDYRPRPGRLLVSDEAAYLLPMGLFLAFTAVGGHWQSLFVASYVAKTLITAVLLILLWPHYTKIRWSYWWLGIILGVIGVVQWVGMERVLLHFWPHYHLLDSGPPFDPYQQFHSPAAMWAFIAIRWAGAALVVPVMEELFWRDYLWRTIAAPADFKLAAVGEWDRGLPLLIVSVAFCTVHFEWLTAIGWGLMVGSLLVLTRSLGACIIMHGVTNFLLGLYVLLTHDWKFW